ncbi:PTS glucose transporter subunit IIA [uncultured Megasphaera sp.]|uniref:PTS sugar transporter subunit IIA n=1 Tax=uncultured Megasphaera sp. TaxID=165188 RepID=UPI00265B25E6|nr:PTS glucose transporter subunit IIA [uncultured Megasphaera sp.]
MSSLFRSVKNLFNSPTTAQTKRPQSNTADTTPTVTAEETYPAETEKTYFCSPFTGELHPITEAPDEAFASKMTGDGFFVYPTDNTVYAPADGTVTFVFDTKHAIGLTTASGLEYLLHIGIDTVQLQGQGFTVPVQEGQSVKKGDVLMQFDREYVKNQASSDACLCVFTNLTASQSVHLLPIQSVQALDNAVWF